MVYTIYDNPSNNPNSFASLIVPWNIWVRTPHRSWFGTKIKLELDLLERGNDSGGTLNSDSGTQKQQTNNFARQKMLCFFFVYYVNVSTKKNLICSAYDDRWVGLRLLLSIPNEWDKKWNRMEEKEKVVADYI